MNPEREIMRQFVERNNERLMPASGSRPKLPPAGAEAAPPMPQDRKRPAMPPADDSRTPPRMPPAREKREIASPPLASPTPPPMPPKFQAKETAAKDHGVVPPQKDAGHDLLRKILQAIEGGQDNRPAESRAFERLPVKAGMQSREFAPMLRRK